jgi:hypothetical protein
MTIREYLSGRHESKSVETLVNMENEKKAKIIEWICNT